MNPLAVHVLVLPWETSRHECWEDAVEQLCVSTNTARENIWQRDTRRGVFVFLGRPVGGLTPIGWIADPVEYQRVRSRGELVDVSAFFNSRAGGGSPARHLTTTTETTMSKPETTTKDKREIYYVLQPVTWKGQERHLGDIIEFRSEATHVNRDRWLKKGSIRELTEDERQRALTPVSYISEGIVWNGKQYRPERQFTVLSFEVDSKLAGFIQTGKVRQLSAEEAAVYQQPDLDAVERSEAAALVPTASGPIILTDDRQVQLVPLERIRPDPTQPRKDFEPTALAELVDSIKVHGVEQAILVRPMSRWRQIVRFCAQQWLKKERGESGYGFSGSQLRAAGVEFGKDEEWGGESVSRLSKEGRIKHAEILNGWDVTAGALEPLTGETTLPGEPEWYEIVYGERRYQASKGAGLTEIPAKVRELTDIEAAEKQGIENLERVDLLPLEVAAQYRKLLDLPGYGMARLMKVTGHKKNTIYGKLQLLKLPEEARAAVARGDLPAVTAERIARLEGDVQAKAMKAILHPERWSLEEGQKVLTDRKAKEAIEQAEREVERKRKLDEMKAGAIDRGLTWMDEGGAEHKKVFGPYGSHPQASSGLLSLSQSVPGDPRCREYAEILKQKTVAKHAKGLKPKAATTRHGELQELYDKAEVKAVLKAADWKVPKTPADPAKAAREAKDKAMRTVVDRAAEQTRERAQAMVPRTAQTPEVQQMWMAVARCVVEGAGYHGWADFITRRGLTMVTTGTGKQTHEDPKGTVVQYLKGKAAVDLAGIIAELTVIGGAWCSWNNSFRSEFVSGMADFGVDLEALVREQGGGVDEESAGARTDEAEEPEEAELATV